MAIYGVIILAVLSGFLLTYTSLMHLSEDHNAVFFRDHRHLLGNRFLIGEFHAESFALLILGSVMAGLSGILEAPHIIVQLSFLPIFIASFLLFVSFGSIAGIDFALRKMNNEQMREEIERILETTTSGFGSGSGSFTEFGKN
jgi:hypothetical protein